MRHLVLCILSILFLLPVCNIFPAIKGSTTTVSIETNFIFPAADSDNKIQGFAWFNDGFSLEDATTSCTFAAVYPVSGDIDLKSGTLYITEDLICTNQVELTGLGSVQGTGHTIMDLCSSISYLPADTRNFKDICIFLNEDLQITSTITFKGNCSIDARNNTIDLSSVGAFAIDANSSLKIRNARVEGVRGSNIYCVDNSGVLELDTIQMLFEGDFTFANGAILYQDQVNFIGEHTFVYESLYTSTIKSQSILEVIDKMEFRLGITGLPAKAKPLHFEDKTSIVHVNNAHLNVLNSGVEFTNGTIEFSGASVVDIDSTSTLNGIVIGNGVAADDMSLRFGPGAILTYNTGHMLFNNASPLFIDAAAHKSSRILRKLGAHFYINQDVVFPDMAVEVDSLFATPNQITDGKTVSFANSQIILPGVEFDLVGTQLNGTTYLLSGNGLVFLNRGTLLFATVIAGTENQILGSGSILSPIVFSNSSSELTIGIDGTMFSDITLAGGTLTLSSNLQLGSGAKIVGPGVVNLATHVLELGPIGVSYTAPVMFTGTAGEVSLRSGVSLSSTWTVDTNCTIQGNNNHISLSGGGEIVVTDGSILTLKNIYLENIQDANIRCLGDDAKIIFEDTTIVQSGDYTFDTGSFSCSNETTFLGTSTFSYASARTSTINLNSCLHITEGVHFCTGRKSGYEPLYFTDSTSILHLDQSSLIITNQGINFTRGKLELDRLVDVEMLGTTSDVGMTWGNGTASDDFIIQFNPGSTFNHITGYLVYKNTQPQGIASPSQDARYLRQISSRIRIEENLEFPDFTGETGVVGVPQAEVVAGKQLTFDNLRVVAPVAEFNVVGSLYIPGVYLLSGDTDELFMTKGTLPLGIVVNNTGSIIRGNGSLSGPITLLNSSADVAVGLNGEVLSNITLNGGKISLSGIFNLGAGKYIIGPGTVDLNTCALHIGQQDSQWAAPLDWTSSGGSINLQSRLDLKETWTFGGTCTINGHGNIIDLTELGNIIVDSDSQLTLKDVSIRNVRETNIKCVDDTASIVLDNASYLFDGNYTFSHGSIKFIGNVDFSGGHCFVYDSSQSSTLDILSELRVGLGLDFNIGRKVEGGSQGPLVCAGSTSIFRLNNCTLSVREHGANFIKGKIICERDVVVDVVATGTTNGLHFGDGTTENDMIFELSPGASVRFTSGPVVYDVTSGNGIQSRSKSSRFYRGETSHTHFKHSLTLAEMKLEAHNLATLTFEPNKFLLYSNTVIAAEDGSFNITGTRLNYAVNVLGGNQSIFLNKGNLLFYTSVGGAGNTMLGNGNVLGQILLQGPTSELTYGINGFVANTVALNGGSLTLSRDMNLASGILINGPGNLVLGSNRLNIGSSELTWPTSLAIHSSNGGVFLHDNFDLTGTWTISGDCTINGGGQILRLQNNGGIAVADGGSLTLRDVQIQGVGDHNICCLNDSGSIVLDNVLWIQDENYTFSTGALQFKNIVEVSGEDTIFAYQSGQTSTILKNSMLKLDEKVTFSYDPISLAQKDLLIFEDHSSGISMKNASLHASVIGLDLKKGNIHIKGNSSLSSDVIFDSDGFVVVDNGISIGNNLSSEDLEIHIEAGSQLRVSEGSVLYKNMNSSSLITVNPFSSIYLQNDTVLHLYQSISLGIGRLVLANNVDLIKENGAEIVGSVITIEE